MILYHVTEQKNLPGILREGLIPNIGGYAAEMGEKKPHVWLFPSREDAEEMIPVWLEPFYGSDLALLEVRLPDDFPLEYTGSDYEVVTTRAIPPNCIYLTKGDL